jgi:hypothetical protein
MQGEHPQPAPTSSCQPLGSRELPLQPSDLRHARQEHQDGTRGLDRVRGASWQGRKQGGVTAAQERRGMSCIAVVGQITPTPSLLSAVLRLPP